MKRRIRLTEGDLHRIVKESVNRILSETVNEGQGWDTFRYHMRHGGMPSFGDDFDEKEFIENGNGHPSQSYRGQHTSRQYYDKTTGAPATLYPGMEDSKRIKPINRGLSGRFGRKFALGALKALNGTGFKAV